MDKSIKRIVIIITLISLLLCCCCGTLFIQSFIPEFLQFHDITEADAPFMYKLKWDKYIDSSGVESNYAHTLYFEPNCDNGIICKDQARQPIIVTNTAVVEDDTLVYPKVAQINQGNSSYLIFREDGGTDGWGTVVHEVFEIDQFGMLQRIDTTMPNTCNNVFPFVYQDVLYFPKNSVCDDFGINIDQYFNLNGDQTTKFDLNN